MQDFKGMLQQPSVQEQIVSILKGGAFGFEKPADIPSLLKSRIQLLEAQSVPSSAPFDERSNPCHSIAYLQFVLGENYKPNNLRENLKCYLKDFKCSETHKKISPEDESLLRAIENCLRFEQEEFQKGNGVFYHGMNGEIFSLSQFMSRIMSLMLGKNVVNSTRGLRLNHLPFINPKTQKQYTVDEVMVLNKEKSDARKLFVNPMLFLNESSSASVEYAYSSVNVSPIDTKNLFLSTMLLWGMPYETSLHCYNEWYSIYHQFCGNARGGMLAISMPESEKSKYFKLRKEEEVASLGEKEEYRRLRPETTRLLSEGIFLIDPLRDFSMRGFWFGSFAPGKQEAYEQALNELACIWALRFLQTQSAPIAPEVILTDKADELLHIKAGSQRRPLTQKMLCPLIEQGEGKVLKSVLESSEFKLGLKDAKLQDAFLSAIIGGKVDKEFLGILGTDNVDFLDPKRREFVSLEAYSKTDPLFYLYDEFNEECQNFIWDLFKENKKAVEERKGFHAYLSGLFNKSEEESKEESEKELREFLESYREKKFSDMSLTYYDWLKDYVRFYSRFEFGEGDFFKRALQIVNDIERRK